tara:strand:- start:10 stop:1383 length:1374 start_codon:yes stop_codon:yes gene_type:complete
VRPTVVQHRVDILGGRARAYDVYVDNAFEARFFWIPILRAYTLLLLTMFDRGLSGRREASVVFAVARFISVSSVLTIFTVCVTVPCPYHRIDRWNIAKMLALLVLNVVAATATMSLTLAELGVAGMHDIVEHLAVTLCVLLPIAFTLVLLAFLLSRGTGCCARCAVSRKGRAEIQAAALARRDAEEAAAALALAFAFRAVEEDAAVGCAVGGAGGSAGGGESRRGSANRPSTTGLSRTSAFVKTIEQLTNGTSAVGLLPNVPHNPSRRKSGARNRTLRGLNPMMVVDASPSHESTIGSSSLSSLSSSESAEDEEAAEEVVSVPKFVVKWRKRREHAPTLSKAIYGVNPAEKAETTLALNAHFATMFGGKHALSVGGVLKILRTRARGTNLGGNMHAQLTLVQASTGGGDSTMVTIDGFAAALHAAIDVDPNGAAAEWLLAELVRVQDGEVGEMQSAL